MIETMQQLRVTVEQMGRMLRALEDMRQSVPRNPQLYSVLMEGPIDQMDKMREEMEEFLSDLESVELKR